MRYATQFQFNNFLYSPVWTQYFLGLIAQLSLILVSTQQQPGIIIGATYTQYICYYLFSGYILYSLVKALPFVKPPLH